MGIADFIALSAVAFTRRFSFTLNQAAIGCKILYRVKTSNAADFIKDGQRHNAANAGEASENMVILAIVMFGMLFNKSLDSAEFMMVKRNDV